jgi:hypothetical protein
MRPPAHGCFFLLAFYNQFSPRPVNMHKTISGSLAGRGKIFSSNLFENCFECGIIFVKYATKAERMLRAAERGKKPI